MTPETFTAIRIKHFGNGSKARANLARVLRISEVKSIYRYEQGVDNGGRSISGPISILMELIDAGELPARYINAQSHLPDDHQQSGYPSAQS